MDLAGLFIAVIGLIVVAYIIGAALFAALFRSLAPKESKNKITIVVCLLAVFGPIVIFGISAISKKNKDHKRKEMIAGICQENKLTITKPVVSPDYFIDYRYLNLLLGSEQSSMDFESLLGFFLKEKFQSLETQYHDGWPNVPAKEKSVEGLNYLKLSIAPTSDERCKPYLKWINEYPMLRYPNLRKLGLLEGSCIAMERASEITSKTRINVEELEIESNNQSVIWTKRFDVALIDMHEEPATTKATLTEHRTYAGGGSAGYSTTFTCGKNGLEKVKDLKKIFTAPENDQIVAPTPIKVLTNTEITVNAAVSNKHLNTYSWIAPVSKDWVTNIISPEGTIWISSQYVQRNVGQPGSTTTLEGYDINILKNGKLFIAPISIAGINATDITGLAISNDRLAVIAFERGNRDLAKRFLVEFDKSGKNVATSELSMDQFYSLKHPYDSMP